MFLRNSFYLFLIPLWIFLYQSHSYKAQDTPKIEIKEQSIHPLQLQTLKRFDTFSIQKEDGKYFYKVLEKYYVHSTSDIKVEEPKVYFTTTISSNLQLVVIAINTGKLVKN